MLRTSRILGLACAAALATSVYADSPVGAFTDHKDLGNPPTDPLAGNATFDAGTGTYTVSGGGNDWWDPGEFGHIVYKSVSGEFRIETNVKYLGTPGDPWTKAGVFVRNDVDTGAGNLQEVNAITAITNPNRTDGTRQTLQYRLASNGTNMADQSPLGAQPNDGTVRIAMQRRLYGTTSLVEGFVDRGDGTYVKIGQQVIPNLANTAFYGLDVTSHNAAVTETAQFSNVLFGAPIGPNPLALSSLNNARTVNTSPGIGAAGQFSVTEVTDNGNATDLPTTIASIDSGTGTRRTYQRGVINVFDSDQHGHFLNDGSFQVVTDGTKAVGSVDNLALIARTGVVIPTTGVYTFGVNSDDGFELSIDGKSIAEFNAGRGAGDTVGSVELAAGVHDLRLLYWEGTGGSSVELYGGSGLFGTFDPSMQLVGDTANGGLAITAAPEPTGLALGAIAVGGLMFRRRRGA